MKEEKKVSPPTTQNIQGMNRRNFLAKSALLGTGLASAPFAYGQSKEGIVTSSYDLSKKRKLGTMEVSPIGLGCMSMTSGHYNPPRTTTEMGKVIRGAVELGVTLFDTAEYYGPFTN